MTNADRNILNETYRISKTSADTIQGLISKAEDEDLAMDLNRQLGQYQRFISESEKYFRIEGEQPKQETMLDRAKNWLNVQAGTALNNSTAHIANMVMQENTKGIGSLMKTLHQNKSASPYYCEFANELMDFTESSINQLKYYLKVV